MRAWNGHMAAWNGRAGNWNRFHHGHFVHRHGRVFFVGGPWWGGYGYLITVAGSGSRRDGDRNGSGSAAATTR
jgi:phosphatidylserine/phosphatidylglycerophosphate/cardiolipin synthase-like enzyme